jgi:hypothetical protein
VTRTPGPEIGKTLLKASYLPEDGDNPAGFAGVFGLEGARHERILVGLGPAELEAEILAHLRVRVLDAVVVVLGGDAGPRDRQDPAQGLLPAGGRRQPGGLCRRVR